MTWQQWTLVVVYVVSAASNVASIGRTREPISPTLAATLVLASAIMVALVVSS